MKLNRYAPLLACGIAALATACDTMPPPGDYPNAPVVKAIYAVDVAQGLMPDVLVYSRDEAGKISKAPPSYNAFRVEFDQPMSGDLANNSDLSGATYCSTKAAGATTAPVQLIDVTGGNRDLASSVCYDPSSSLGSFPHVTVVIGSGVALSPTPDSPFTCQDFIAEDGSDKTGRTLLENEQYAIKLDPSRVKGRNDKQLDTTGVTGGVYSFTTDDFSIMAEGYQDQSTGYYIWQSKPATGFMKDLAPVASGQFVMPADTTPYLIATSLPAGNADTAVTVTRGDGSPIQVSVDNGYEPGGRLIEVVPDITWEPGTTYKITIGKSLAGANGKVPFTSDQVITFTTAPGPISVIASSPGAGATAVSIGSSVTVEFNMPIDPTTVNTTNLVLKDAAGNPVAGTTSFTAAGEGYAVNFKPTKPTGQLAALLPSTTYTLTASGLKTGPACPTPAGSPGCAGSNAGKDVPTKTVTFTTSSFTMSAIARLTTAADGSPVVTSINNSTTVNPVALVDNSILAIFNDPPSTATGEGVTTDSLKVYELTRNPTTGIVTPTPFTATAVTASGTANVATYSVKVTDPAFVLKFGQAYALRAATSIKDVAPPAGSGLNLKAEGCTKTGADCYEQKGFTTNRLGASLTRITKDANGNPTQLKVTFTGFPVDTASLGSQADLNSRFKVYKVDAAGARTEQFAGQITCALPTTATTTSVTCTLPASLDVNTNYVATAVFPKDKPAMVPAQINGFNTDRDPNSPTAGVFFGTLGGTTTFLTACKAP